MRTSENATKVRKTTGTSWHAADSSLTTQANVKILRRTVWTKRTPSFRDPDCCVQHRGPGRNRQKDPTGINTTGLDTTTAERRNRKERRRLGTSSKSARKRRTLKMAGSTWRRRSRRTAAPRRTRVPYAANPTRPPRIFPATSKLTAASTASRQRPVGTAASVTYPCRRCRCTCSRTGVRTSATFAARSSVARGCFRVTFARTPASGRSSVSSATSRSLTAPTYGRTCRRTRRWSNSTASDAIDRSLSNPTSRNTWRRLAFPTTDPEQYSYGLVSVF